MEHSAVKNVTTYTHRIPVGCSKQLAVSQPWGQPLAPTLQFLEENLSRPNWLPPDPSPTSEYAPSTPEPKGKGTHLLGGEGWRVPIRTAG